jgi:putative endonuclease
MRGGWVYIMTNKPFGTLYIGVTGDLAARVWQHRTGRGAEFCKRHRLHMLVYAEQHSSIVDAIVREKAMKAWKRNWKLRQIMDMNPEWRDLFDDINR